MEALAPFHLDAALGIALLGWLIFSKVSELRARRGALELEAEVVKVFPHRHCTAYFVRYAFEGAQRTAEYRGAPLVTAHKPGDTLRILIDPRSTPDVAIPDAVHDAPGAGVGGGTCSLAGTPLVTWLDVIYAAAAVALIARSFA